MVTVFFIFDLGQLENTQNHFEHIFRGKNTFQTKIEELTKKNPWSSERDTGSRATATTVVGSVTQRNRLVKFSLNILDERVRRT